MKYKYIRWDEDEALAVFFPDVQRGTWQILAQERDYANPLLIISMPSLSKADLLLLFEYYILLVCGQSIGISRWELDTLMLLDTHKVDCLDENYSINVPRPTYISEYLHIMGQLFLAGYIDFGSFCDDDRNRVDYPTNLSYYKKDKYQAWVHFRDNFFYANKFNRDLDEPSANDQYGYSLILGDVSWDEPQHWSQYNIWIALTPKGDDYFNHILAPKFYEKYKDLEVEIDDQGNILGWYDGGVRV